MAASASVAGAWYNAGTSYNLAMMGIGATPLQMGTGRAQNMTSVESAIGQRFGFGGFDSKTGTFDSKSLAANLDNPLFIQQIMTATGMSQDQYNQWAQSWAQTNTMAATSGKSVNTIQSEISAYMNGSGGDQAKALKDLEATPGFNMSMLQSMGQATAGKTAIESASSNAFVSGLQDTTTAVNILTNQFAVLNEKLAGTEGISASIATYNALGIAGAGGQGTAGTAMGLIAAGWKSVATAFNSMESITMAALAAQAAQGTGGKNQGQPGSGGGPGSGPAPTGAIAVAIHDAEAQVGKPYVWGGSSPQTSFDCSGLVYWAYGQAGIHLPRTSQEQWAALQGKSVSLSAVQAGDIVFAAGSDGTFSAPGHEALMVSGNQIVEAAHTGTNIRIRPYVASEWQHAARPAETGGDVVAGAHGIDIGGVNGKASSAMNTSNTSGILSGTTARPAQAPWSAGPPPKFTLGGGSSRGTPKVLRFKPGTFNLTGVTDIDSAAKALVKMIETQVLKAAATVH
jgi:cell wall-associated NlpC family hydrolase